MKKQLSESCKKCGSNKMCIYYKNMKKLIIDARKENFLKKLKMEKKNFLFEISL